MKNVHPCTFFIDEICDERKSRFYMEPAASVPRFACEVEQPVKQLYICVHFFPTYIRVCREKASFVHKTCFWLTSRPSLGVLMTSFSIEKLTTVWNHRRPWQVQKLTSMSIFEREFLLGKNVAAV